MDIKLVDYVQFIGSVRSGHTLVAQIINAHPEAVISDECDVVGNMSGFKDNIEMFKHILKKDRQWVRNGCRSYGYRYHIGYWQGMFRELRIIGDKHAGPNTTLFKEDGRLEEFMRFVNVPFKFIWVKRDRERQIDSMYEMRRKRNLVERKEIERYWEMQQEVAGGIFKKYGGLIIDIDGLRVNKREGIVGLMEFLGLDLIEEHIDICKRFIK